MSMFFKKKRANNSNSQSNDRSNRNGDSTKKRPAILMDDEDDSNDKDEKKDKQKVSLFDHRSSQSKNKERDLDRLVAEMHAKKFNSKIIDLLGYKGLTHDKNHFLKLSPSVIDGGRSGVHDAKYADILKIGGTGIDNLPEEMIQRLLSNYVSFWRSYFKDVTCICLPLPNDSKDQQHDWQMQIDRENQKLLDTNIPAQHRKQILARRDLIQENLDTLQSVDQYLINQGFCLLTFGDSENELATNVTNAITFSKLSLNLSRLDVRDKEAILKRINNPDMML